MSQAAPCLQKSIKMKVFCETCRARIGKNEIEGMLTSCQHILCHICYESVIRIKPKSCPICKRRDFSAMKIEREMRKSVMEYFLPPDDKLQRAIDVVRFQNKHMNWYGMLNQVQRAEEFKLVEVEKAKRLALAEWNAVYDSKMEEYRRNLRVTYKHLTALQMNKADLTTQRAALKETHILLRKTAKLLEVNSDPTENTLATLFQKHLEIA